MAKAASSRRVQVRPGQTALAPRVDHPRAFAIRNGSGRPLTVSFRYDPELHVQTILVEEEHAARRGAAPLQGWSGGGAH